MEWVMCVECGYLSLLESSNTSINKHQEVSVHCILVASSMKCQKWQKIGHGASICIRVELDLDFHTRFTKIYGFHQEWGTTSNRFPKSIMVRPTCTSNVAFFITRSGCHNIMHLNHVWLIEKIQPFIVQVSRFQILINKVHSIMK